MARVFKQKDKKAGTKRVVFVVVVIAIVILLYFGIENFGSSHDERQMQIAHDAIIKASVQCYALEAQFPPSLDYLVENYGITLDRDKYIYHYQGIASNMVPEIKIFANNSTFVFGEK